MIDAKTIERLSEIEEELNQINRLIDRKADLENEANQLSKDLFESMKIQDVYESGNYGHQPRKLRWLIDLFRDWKESQKENANKT